MSAQILEMISKDEKEHMLYESQLLYETDQEAEWRYRERKAIEKGIEKGERRGEMKLLCQIKILKSLVQFISIYFRT